MLIIRCPRCNEGNVAMAHFWSEYLCQSCLKCEEKSLRQRQIESRKPPGTQDKSKSLSPCRHTLEDGADATTELVSGKSSGFIGGMQ